MEHFSAKLEDYNTKLETHRAWLKNMIASNRAAPTPTTTTLEEAEEEQEKQKDPFTTLLHNHDTKALTRILLDIQTKMEQEIARRQGLGEKISLKDGKRYLDEFFADVRGEGGRGKGMSQETSDWLGRYFPRLEETVEGLCLGEGKGKKKGKEKRKMVGIND